MKILLPVILILSFVARVVGQWANVFTPYGILLTDVDAYYHLRLAENMAGNFPHWLVWDNYAVYPSGAHVGYAPGMSWLIAGLSDFIPSANKVVIAAAFVSPLLSVVTIISVYFLGKVLTDSRLVGILSASLVAFMPSEFLHRTLLGFADHHSLEVALTVPTILFIVAGEKYVKWWYGILAGITLGMLHLSWYGSIMLTGVILLWYLLITLWEQWQALPLNENRYAIALLTFLISFLVFIPYWRDSLNPKVYAAVLGIAAIAPLVLTASIRYFLKGKALIITILSLFITGTLTLAILNPVAMNNIVWGIRSIVWGGDNTIQEASPSTLPILVFCYGIAWMLAILGIYLVCIRRLPLLFILWSLLVISIMLGQRRWGYYAAVPIAILAAYTVHYASIYVKENVRSLFGVMASLAIFASFISNSWYVIQLPNSLTLDWYVALKTLQKNTQEPSNGYFSLVSDKPEYGVLSWWDYGHYIITIAHRAPVTSPTYQDEPIGSKFFMAQSEEEAMSLLDGWNIRYVIIDNEMLSNKFFAIVRKATGSFDGTLQLLPNSQAYRMWSGKSNHWSLVFEKGGVKVFQKISAH